MESIAQLRWEHALQQDSRKIGGKQQESRRSGGKQQESRRIGGKPAVTLKP